MNIKDVSNGIPVRAPGESPIDYLQRLKDYQSNEDIVKLAIKEADRREKRIRSMVERVLIEKEVRKALSARDPRGKKARFYRIPNHPEMLFIFAPLYLLLSIIFQDITHSDIAIDQRVAITKNKDIK